MTRPYDALIIGAGHNGLVCAFYLARAGLKVRMLERRGVISVGPAMTRRGDPIGIFSRDVVWTPVREVLVRPHLVPMESLGAGLMRPRGCLDRRSEPERPGVPRAARVRAR